MNINRLHKKPANKKFKSLRKNQKKN